MNRIYTLCIAAVALALVACGCGKTVKTGLNDANKKYFDSWLLMNYPDAKKVDPGIYVISETVGDGWYTGDAENNPYLRMNYIKTDLDGNITDSNMESVKKQLGTYDKTSYYGPVIWYRGTGSLTAGMEAAIYDMREGGSKQIIIPGWLNTLSRYETEEEYMDNVSGSNSIYTITLEEVIPDITQWEIDSLERYVKAEMQSVDSTKYGFYYLQTKAPDDPDASFSEADKVYINYTGKLLNGQVFDTTIKDTAKVWNIYSSDKTYEPTYVQWATDYTNLVLGAATSANMIDGFAYCVSLMKPGEKGICAFYSDLGYKYSGSGDRIPGYSPIAFEIEMIGVNIY